MADGQTVEKAYAVLSAGLPTLAHTLTPVQVCVRQAHLQTRADRLGGRLTPTPATTDISVPRGVLS